ncbi:MAG: YfhO family protein [Flavobacteriales bacterium]|nr:YfhO family protein [Flavobacteriales bacterium]
MNGSITANSTAEVGIARVTGVFALMVLVCILAFHGIASMHESLKWDATDCYLPWRYFVGESLDHGIFPLWNPYQHFGYPIHADMRSVFYIEGLIVGLAGGYSVQLLNVLFILYLSVAGTGMYLLAGHFTSMHRARIMGGIAYMLSGFVVGHGQDLACIIAAAFIPWAVHYFIRLQRHAQWPDLWKLAFFLFLQLTGGYQALNMMLLYLLIFLFLVELWQRRRQQGHLLRILTMNALLSVIVLVSLTVLMVTFYQVSPHIQRFAGVTLKDAQFMPFSPQCLISLLTPFAVVTDTDFYDTDLSMGNGHFGLLMLIGLLSALFRRRGMMENIFLGFGLLCLFASFGRYTPVREWLFHHAPLMDLFRMSAFFYYFALLAFILIATAELGRFIGADRPQWKRPFAAAMLLFIAIAGIGIYFFQTNAVTYRPLVFLSEYRDSLGQTPRVNHVLIHAVIQCGLLLLLMVGLWLLRHRSKAFSWLLMGFLLIEMGVSVHLNFPITVGSGQSPALLQSKIDQNPQGFPLPDLSVAVGTHRDGPQFMSPLWRNTNILTKTVSFEGFNSFRLDAFEHFREETPAAFEAILARPVVFFSDSSTADRSDTIIMERFAPSIVAFTVNASTARSITLLQTDYQGWQGYLDGEAVQHAVNGIFPTLSVPAGATRVEFHYRNPGVMAGLATSYGMFAINCLALLYFLLREHAGFQKRRAAAVSIGLMGMMGLLLIVSWSSKKSDEEQRLAGYAELARSAAKDNGTPMLLLADKPHLFDSLRMQTSPSGDVFIVNSPSPQKLHALRLWLADLKAKGHDTIALGSHRMPLHPHVREILLQSFDQEMEPIPGRPGIRRFVGAAPRPALFSTISTLEEQNPHWPHDAALADTAHAFSGRHSWRMDAVQPGSPAIWLNLSEQNAETMRKAVVEMKVKLSSKEANAAIFFKIEREGKVIWEMAEGFHQQSIGTEVWFDVMLVARPPMQLLPKDRIQVFAWGGSNDPLWVDDLRLSLYDAP